MTKNIQHKKSGAALVIALGFLAILTIMIIVFSAQTRTERLAGRAYLSTAKTRHLLNSALSRALEDVDATVGTNYPGFLPIPPQNPTDGTLVGDSMDFTIEEDFFQTGNPLINQAYRDALDSAEWQTISAGNTPIGRIGYIVINSSGLLDANSVGGGTTDYIERNAGVSPAEIQLSKTPRLIDEFNGSAATFPHIDKDTPSGIQRTATNPDLSPGFAFSYNRDHAWRRFETLRDIYKLNRIGSPKIITTPIESFSTYSFSPTEQNERTPIINESGTPNVDFISEELAKIQAIPDPEFVLNQLRDYLDTDTIPEDINGNYTDLSVEPVPLINEMALVCNFTFLPQIEENEDDDGNITMEVTSVIISNQYSLELEVWYPFVGYENTDRFAVHINETPEQTAELPLDLFNEVSEWIGDYDLPADLTTPDSSPYNFTIYNAGLETEVLDGDDMTRLFQNMQSDIQFPSIYCDNDNGIMVDRVLNLELQLENSIADDLLPIIDGLSTNLFNLEITTNATVRFVASMACVDPRLNWDGESLDQWKEESDAGENASAGTMGDINETVINDHTSTPDPTDKIFVRNEGRIDTPYEFTYFLYDPSKPWKTFQFIEENDDDDTRFIIEHLSPYPKGPPRYGRINPFSPHTNVIASVFMNMPMDEFNNPATLRMDEQQATQAAERFMDYVANNGWPTNAAEYGRGITFSELQDVMDNNSQNPWIAESFFRNTYELFNPRDTLYTLILAAQSGHDRNGDGTISDDEVQSTQKAVVYVWRDPASGKAACVFYGLSDTLQSTLGGQTWGTILQEFQP